MSLPGAKLDYPFGKEVAVYKVDSKQLTANSKRAKGRGQSAEEKMFALITEGKQPVQLSLKCDPGLSNILREKYESVMPGYHLNKKHWNTLLLTGQLSWPEVQDLIRHSYQLVCGN